MARTVLRVVLDANVLLSAVLFGGKPGQVLDLWRQSQFELAISPELLAEFSGKLRYKFAFPDGLIAEWEAIFNERAIQSLPDYTTKICRDPDDDKLLDLALAAGATYLVTGDDDLLTLETYEQVLIVKPAAFLEEWRRP